MGIAHNSIRKKIQQLRRNQPSPISSTLVFVELSTAAFGLPARRAMTQPGWSRHDCGTVWHPPVELPASPASLLLPQAKMVAGGDCCCRTDGCAQVGWLEMEELLLWSFPGYLQMVGIGHRHRCGPAGRGSWSPVEDRERENGRRGEQGWSSDARGAQLLR